MNKNIQKIKKRLKKSKKYLPKVVTAVIVLAVALLGTYLLFEAHAASNPPTVTISNLSDDGYVNSSSQAVDVTATPNDGGSISSCTLSINSATIGNPITTAPFNFTFIPLNFANGYINLSVSCTDDQGDIGTVSETPIVNNGDLTNAGIVGIADLAIMASNWDKTGQTYAQGNITGNGAVGVSDLAILASNWGWKAPVLGSTQSCTNPLTTLWTTSSATGTATANSTIFTDPNASFSSSDVGQYINIVGAGSAGANLYTTIAAVNSATSLTLTVAASTALTGDAHYQYGPTQYSADSEGLWYVQNDVWSPNSVTPPVQSTQVCSPSSWNVIANIRAEDGTNGNPGGNGVQSYPATEYDIGGRNNQSPPNYRSTKPISAYASITSTFSELFPTTGDSFDAAYDNWTIRGSTWLETMIWNRVGRHAELCARQSIDLCGWVGTEHAALPGRHRNLADLRGRRCVPLPSLWDRVHLHP